MGNKRKISAHEASNVPYPAEKRIKTAASTSNGDKSKAKPRLDLDPLRGPFVEDLTKEERLRESTLYKALGSEDTQERVDAADAIIFGLFSEDVPESVVERHLQKRLLRGLASGANASRVGFSLVLTEALERLFGQTEVAEPLYPNLTFGKVVQMLVEKTTPAGNIPGQEERDYYFGQLFGFECFIRANVLFLDETRWDRVLGLLLNLATKKVWSRPQCGWMIVQAVNRMSRSEAKKTLEALEKAQMIDTSEGVAVRLACAGRFPELGDLPGHLGNPLAPKRLPELVNILKDSGRQQDEGDAVKKSKQGNWSAQLHFVWDLIRAYFVRMEIKDETQALEHFRVFWNRVVDGGFFSKTASDAQKFSGFMIFQKILSPGATHEFFLETIFSQNLMNCLMNQASVENRYLHRAAVKALNNISEAVEAEPEPVILKTILVRLLGEHGAYNFDQRTHRKTVETLLKSIRSEAEDIIRVLRAPVLILDSDDAQEVENKRLVYADYLLAILNGVISIENRSRGGEVIPPVLEELMRIAYSQEAAFSPPLSVQTREVFRSRVGTAFGRLIKSGNNQAFVCEAIMQVKPDAVEMDHDVASSLQAALDWLSMFKPQTLAASGELLQGYTFLHAVGVFLLINGDEEAISILGDLEKCRDAVNKHVSAFEHIELVTEILLSLVSRSSVFMKQASNQVFEQICGFMNQDSLEVLTKPLEAEENDKGKQLLFNSTDDMADDEEDETMADGEEAASSSETSESEDGSEDNESESGSSEKSDEEGDDGLQALDDALADILNTHRLDKDAEAAESSDDSDMSDSEMMVLDEQLSAAFKKRAQKKGSSRKDKQVAKETVVNFKNRVLDFVEIFLKTQPMHKLSGVALQDLLRLMKYTKTKALATRACGIVITAWKAFSKERVNHKPEKLLKVPSLTDHPDEGLYQLDQIHYLASNSQSHAYTKAASTASLLIASRYLHFAEDKQEAIRNIWAAYGDSMAQWVTGVTKMQPSFFVDCVNWMQGIASTATAKAGKGAPNKGEAVTEDSV